jgi:hypothetical protein
MSDCGSAHGQIRFRRRQNLFPLATAKMTLRLPEHPVDNLSSQEKCHIYYSRVVDLAVAYGLLIPDPDSEVGHFAFSRHYYDGKVLDGNLTVAIREFEKEYPELVLERRADRNGAFMGTVDAFTREKDTEKVEEFILIGASYAVWPAGTSFTLTYPWDLNGQGRIVQFRRDLSDFMKRRIRAILRKTGKLRNPNLFIA